MLKEAIMAIMDRAVDTTHSRHDDNIFESRQPESAPELTVPNGAACAAILAAGLGSALYGLIVLLAESNEAFRSLMILNTAVGPLSGKSTFGVLAWLAVWGVLHLLWRNKNLNFARVWTATLVLIGLSLVLTFPLFFMLFASE
jgi:hypothetical protein